MPPRKRRGRLFVAQPRHPVTGERLYLTAETERELEARLQRVRELGRDYHFGAAPEATSRALRPALGRVLTVDEAWSRYVATMRPRAREHARAVWEHNLQPYLAGLKAHQLNPDTMAAWLLEVRSTGGRTGHGRAPNTIWLAYDLLAAAFARLLGSEMTALPWGKWRPGVPRGQDGVLQRRACLRSFAELPPLLAAARAEDARVWARGGYSALTATVAVLCLTGMRQAECAGLGWDSVELTETPLLHIHYQAPRGWRAEYPGASRPPAIPKGKRKRTQVLHSSAAIALLEQRTQLERRGWYAPDGPCFPAPRSGGWRETGQVLKPARIRALVAAAGLPNPHLWTVHSTRHTFATLEAQAMQGDLAAVKARTGHASVAQLEGYYHPGPSRSVPELPPGLLSSALDTEGAPLPAARAVGELPPRPVASAPRAPAEPAPLERAPSWADLATHWAGLEQGGELPKGRNGRTLTRPPEVSERARVVQRRGNKKAKKAGKTPEECRLAGQRARAATLGAWARELERARRRLRS